MLCSFDGKDSFINAISTFIKTNMAEQKKSMNVKTARVVRIQANAVRKKKEIELPA